METVTDNISARMWYERFVHSLYHEDPILKDVRVRYIIKVAKGK